MMSAKEVRRAVKKKIIAAALAFVLCISAVLGCAFAAGSSADPLITLTYLNGTVKAALLTYISEKTDLDLSPIEHDLFGEVNLAGTNALESIDIENLAGELAWNILDELADEIVLPAANSYRLIELDDGLTITAREGTVFYVVSGPLDAVGGAGDIIIDLRDAYECNGGWVFSQEAFLIVGEGSTYTLDASYTYAAVYISGDITINDDSLYTVQYKKMADALRDMGLFKGTGTSYELERRSLRSEAMTMLVRLLGAESTALSLSGTPPYTDLETWLIPYVNYAHINGLTLGIGDNLFGSCCLTPANQYMTFILRALGYADTGDNPDFNYLTAVDDAVSLGVLTQNEAKMFNSTAFRRDQMVYMSFVALLSEMKNSSTTLLQSLIEKGVLDEFTAYLAIDMVRLVRK